MNYRLALFLATADFSYTFASAETSCQNFSSSLGQPRGPVAIIKEMNITSITRPSRCVYQ